MILQLFNGDCAYEAWKKAALPGEALVWRENYLDGQVPGPEVPLAEFERIRAVEIHRWIPALAEERLLAALSAMDEKLAGLTGEDTLYLWFDCCMFDMTMLARVLYLLSLNPVSPEMLLICRDYSWGDDPAFFTREINHARPLSAAELASGATAWRAFCGRNRLELTSLAQRGDWTFCPSMGEALLRFAEDLPDTADSLGRTRRQLLESVKKGASRPIDIFRALSAYEKYPFMGDTSCWRHLDALADAGYLSIINAEDRPARLGDGTDKLDQLRISVTGKA